VVIQVADADPAKWRLALDQATEVAEYAEGRVFDVVVIAYGPGLGMLRSASPVRTAIERSQQKGVRFVACGNTMETERVRAAQLLPGVMVASAGATLEILALQKAGYAYVRI
jgi:intracellular sulfur oxidation DsrE/DsrF family protein